MIRVTELDRSDVLSGLFATWDNLDRLLTGLSEQQWQTPTPLPGWSVHAVVSHIIGTESALMGIPTPDADIDVSALAHVRNEFGAMNECWVRHLSAESGADLQQRFRAVTNDRRKRLTDMSDDDWNALTPNPAGQDSYGRFMRVRVFDCWIHEHDIRDALGSSTVAAGWSTTSAVRPRRPRSGWTACCLVGWRAAGPSVRRTSSSAATKMSPRASSSTSIT